MIIRTRIGRGCSARWVTALPLAACALLATPLMAQSPDQIGRWDPPPQAIGPLPSEYDWPLAAMHAVVVNDGRVLVWWEAACGSADDERLWDPSTGALTSVISGENIDCAGHAGMADGSILVTGGGCGANDQDSDHVRRFTLGSGGPWVMVESMHHRRWYPTSTTLPDGRILTAGGADYFSDPTGHTHVDVPEIYDPVTDSWQDASQYHYANEMKEVGQYPFMFVMPDGRVFFAGSLTGQPPGPSASNPTAILDVNDPDWTWEDIYHNPSTSLDTYGNIGGRRSAVMYEPGKVLVTGGNHGNQGRSDDRSVVIDLDVEPPSLAEWQEVDAMHEKRNGHELVILPDGKILAVGGVDYLVESEVTSEVPVYQAEWIDPHVPGGILNASWQQLAIMVEPRRFHSVTVLLPDGRVLAAGGNGPILDTGNREHSAEVFSPPYLFHNVDELAPRPVVGFAPRAVDYDEEFRVTLAAGEVDAEDIARVTMVRPGAVTHGFDSNQRFIELDFTIDAANNRVEITAPLNGNVAPPGEWMLFLIADTGVPSVGKFIRLTLP